MRVGSLFSGYGGLDLAVGGDLAWYSEIEPAACKVLAAHHPGVPNLGDITQVNWSDVPPASQELKMLGNGVVPQQARLAVNLLAAA